MATDLAFYVGVTLLVVLAGLMLRPTHGVCPAHWHNEGVRHNGVYSCRRDTADGPFKPGEIFGVVVCDDSDQPVVVDQRTIVCRRAP
jgi:hypothetical protein